MTVSRVQVYSSQTIFDILKFILGYEAWGNKTKEMYYSLSREDKALSSLVIINYLKMISFVLFPQALKPSMNSNISELVYWGVVIF